MSIHKINGVLPLCSVLCIPKVDARAFQFIHSVYYNSTVISLKTVY